MNVIAKQVFELDYRPITLLNTELKILARVLANRLQLVISDLIGPEQTVAVKGRSIQDNLHLIREVLEGIEDGTEAALISLDQSKAFDRVDHRFLASVLETAGFKPEFRPLPELCGSHKFTHTTYDTRVYIVCRNSNLRVR